MNRGSVLGLGGASLLSVSNLLQNPRCVCFMGVLLVLLVPSLQTFMAYLWPISSSPQVGETGKRNQ